MTVIRLEDAGAFVGTLSEELRAKALVGVRKAAARGLQTVVSVIIPSRTPQPVDRGIYRAGYKVQSTPNGADIYDDDPIAGIIENGVRAANIKIGRKMLTALAQWAIRKGLVKRKGGKHRYSKQWDDAMSMAWAIAKKAKQGKGFHNQRPGGGLKIQEQLNKDFIPRYLREEVPRAMNR